MDHPVAIGERLQLAVMLALQAADLPFLVPFGENTRYDLVLDLGDRFVRIQCKTGRLRDGAIRFAACSTYAHHPNPRVRRRDSTGEVDYFAVYCPDLAGVYLVPWMSSQTACVGHSVVSPTRNNQRLGVRLAGYYHFADVSVEVAA